jgi:hypothetical protein
MLFLAEPMAIRPINWKGTTAGWLAVVLPIMAAEWIGFKCLYPYADYFTDSYSYIQAAAQGDAISYRPIGYSLFLRLVHGIAVSDTWVVTLQYMTVQGAALGLVLSLRRWCSMGNRTVAILMGFVLLNPAIPYVCNYISSDALFIGLSLLWLTVLMGLLRDPGWWRLGLQVMLLFVIFNLRYVALFYPAVAALTVLFARRGWVFSVVGVAASIGIVVMGTLWIKAITKRETGADLFSAFSGWQIANNALNLYTHLPVDTAGLPSAECRELADYVRDYFEPGARDSGVVPPGKGSEGQSVAGTGLEGQSVAGTGLEGQSVAGTGLEAREERSVGSAETRKAPAVTTAYMWIGASPLHRYLLVYKQRNKLSYFDAWNRVGVVFSQYGYHVARKHPWAYLHYYAWPSAKSFFMPDLDNVAVYNEGKADVDAVAKDWFHYRSRRVRVYSATMQARVLAIVPVLYLLSNIAFLVAAILFLPFRALRERDPVFTVYFRLACAFLLANAFFGILASPSVFRYQVLPLSVLFIFAVAGVAKIAKKAVI